MESHSTQPRRGRVLLQREFTPTDCGMHPDRLYVFGDNMAGWGTAGQAVIRHERNAIGVPTKRYPGREPEHYFTDADADDPQLRERLAKVFRTLREAVENGIDVVLPERGLGTGMGQLGKRAPRIRRMIDNAITKLQAISEGNDAQ